MENSTLDLARELISRPSVTPDDAGCQDVIGQRLQRSGFDIERLNFGSVSNLWATWGEEAPVLCFAGHTDVVPPGPKETWNSDPFSPSVTGDYLFGRGAADMKSALAAMVTAAEEFTGKHKHATGSLAFLITSDEEGIAVNGTKKVIEVLARRNKSIDWCVVGEPSSTQQLGDLVRIGRRGSLTATVRIRGIQGHVAFPDKALNPIHAAAPVLTELCQTVWDDGNEHFPPTGFQIPLINAGTDGATNVIPGDMEFTLNFRFSTESTQEHLRARVEDLLEKHDLDYELDWHLSGNPFITEDSELIDCVQQVIENQRKLIPELSTGGGTSDGRFIAPSGAQVVELGVVNETIHQVNECVRIEDIRHLHHLYLGIMEHMLITRES